MTMDDIRDIVQTRVGELTPAGKRCARVLLACYPAIGLGTAAEWAAAAGTSMPTVLRVVSYLGFGTYRDFQQRLREESMRIAMSPVQRATRSREDDRPGDYQQLVERRVTVAGEVLRAVPASEFEAAVSLLAGQPRRIHLAGGVFSTHFAALLAAQLGELLAGVSYTLDPLVRDLAKYLDLETDDVVVLFDFRRYEEASYKAAQLVKRRKARLIVVTDHEMSPTAELADVVLPVYVDGVPFDSHVGVLVLVESLVEGVFDALGPKSIDRMACWEENVRLARAPMLRHPPQPPTTAEEN
ncbi:MurR/RpiR family transcriptional regulator [Microbacterium profundi]|uniref:MurR/RpiR family transcriptional regulator n=1 Tax=Microbacterium profundi TaxID=450380 RepID=UPI001F3CC14A|nr:MurR/RpiR family transcriptional regulator [Microbacterium profundi]MCE7482023.1 MurR/RpiR family transcriptional regulator [Microbacterium profundi]